MSAARKIITGLNDLRVFPHAVTRLTAKEIFVLNGDGICGQGGN